MPNGSFTLGVYSENDIETWRDLIFYVAQVLGGFLQIDRTGKLKLVKYGSTSVADIPDTQRFSSSFSDFITRYTAVSSTNVRTKTAEYYALDPDDGLTMDTSNAILINKVRKSFCNIGLNFNLQENGDELLETHTINPTVFINSTASSNYGYYDFIDGEDGYWYGFMSIFRDVFNEWFVADTSKKIRAVFKAKALNGQHSNSVAPYGYKPSEADKFVWAVDEPAADVVRDVFKMCVDGM